MKYIYIITLGLALIVSSCSAFNKQLYSGNINTDTYAHYSNDSIQFSVDLAGDHFQNKEKKDLKRKLKTYNLNPFKNNAIESFETIIDPYFDVFLFHFKDKKEFNSFIKYKGFQHTKHNKQSGQIEIKDKAQFAIGSATTIADSSYVLLLSYAKEKTLEDYELMNKEYTKVFETLRYGADYKNEVLKE